MKFHFKNIVLIQVIAFATTLLGADIAAAADITVNLTAQRTNTLLPDGKTVPMWGYCATGTTACGGTWAPGPTITVAAGDNLNINLTNQLPTPTSVWILGQMGGGLGQPVYAAGPVHAGQTTTTFPGVGVGTFTPPAQGQRVRSFVPEAAENGGTHSYSWANLKPGTYLYETSTHPSIQVPMGLYGVLIVTAPGATYPGVAYDAEATLMYSEIDPVQNAAVDAAAAAACAAAPCVAINEGLYPPAVNYSPRYFLINGHAFDKAAPVNSVYAIPGTYSSGNILVRFANAGLRSHTPSFVGLPLTLLAEDGYIAKGTPKVQNEVMVEAGKTRDVVVMPTHDATVYTPATYSLFDRQLSMTNDNQANGGMQGFLQVNGGANGGALTTTSATATPFAVNDTYTNPAGTSFNGNVILNDILLTSVAVVTGPEHGTLTLNPDGTFSYVPTPDPSGMYFAGVDSFTYNGNTGTSNTATVTLNETAAPVAEADDYTSQVATALKVARPGVLGNDSDPVGYTLTAQVDPSRPLPSWIKLNADGSFIATPPAAGSYSFTYVAVNSLNMSSTPATVTLNFPAASGLALTVQDTQDPSITLSDYSWVLEEDTTYKNDPINPTQANNCTPAQAQAGTCTPPQSLATNFHKSYMPVVATGCTGPKSCGDAQPATKQSPSFVRDVALDPTKHYYISVKPGDAADPVILGAAFGHTMTGVSIAPGQLQATALAARNPLPPAQMSIFVFEDNGATNGDVDEGEVGLGGFRIEFADTRGSSGDVAGTITYDTFGMPLTNSLMDGSNPDCPKTLAGASEVGVVITCPDLRADGTPSPLAGMALVKNMIPGRVDVFAMPGAEREAAGEKWIQISTLEGTRANDAFTKAGEPPYWQEFGSPGFHSFIGFVNPAHVKAVNDANVAAGATGTVSGRITSLHMDRPPAAKLNNSCQPGSTDPACARAALSYTNCYVALNELGQTGRNIAMTHCDDNGNFTLKGIPNGSYMLFIWDDWLDQIKAMKAVTVASQTTPVQMGDVPVFTWFTRLQQTVYSDLNKNGVRDPGEPGISNLPMTVRFRDGTFANIAFTDSNGTAEFDEIFPLFNWYVVEADTTRFKGTGVNVTYDAGGLTDLTGPYAGVLNSTETTPLPANLQVPGAKYTAGTTNRIDPPSVTSEGFQGFINQTQVIDWGRTPYNVGENGGITGMVFYAPTRGTDDPRLEVQTLWSPGIPRVPVNLYLKKADGNLQLVDTTTSSSWDDTVSNPATAPHCPGDDALTDPFITYTLGAANQFKCYDGQHAFSQVQPAVYDGRYRFPSADMCKICTEVTVTNPDGTTKQVPQLPPGTYVVEVSPPTGYEIVKEEDKNIYGGDSWIGPAVQQFAGFGNVFILPDQATLNSNYNPVYGPANPPCVGNTRLVPPFLSEVPESQLYTPFAGHVRPLCDRKEVVLGDMTQALADFPLFTATPVAAHFTGMMLNDAAAEFDPYSPSFGEKAALPNAPVSIRDYNGVEILRTYNDKWGTFNGLVPSTWNANVPNPSGYAENMLTNCMNDPGPIIDRRPNSSTFGQLIIDPMYNPMFSNFCYTWPFMPGTTTYLDTPVLPVAAFASGATYNPVDCQYPDATPAIKRVDGNGVFGPYIDMAKGNRILKITALGDVDVPNPAYLGPTSMSPSTNQPKIKRHYGFGSGAARSPNTTNFLGQVTLGGRPLTITSWSDSVVTVAVPNNAVTGELEITASNGKKLEDSVTVTIEDSRRRGYRPPTFVSASKISAPDPMNNLGLAHPIQDAIDAAKPGDLIMLNEGIYPELVIMWKPVRLQGVGAAAVMINAAKYPTTKIDNWRARINPLFGVDAQGNALPGISQVDPLPGQTVTGGLVQFEPTALSSEEGPGIIVLAKDPSIVNCRDKTPSNAGLNSLVKDSNFICAPSRIDGVTVTGGDTGGGIYVNGWAHNLEISNNRIYGNAGTVNGGLRIGQVGLGGQPSINHTGLGYNMNVKIHHNAITTNGTVEANAAILTPGGAAPGGIAIFAGSDNYRVEHNWVCGNFSSGDGGGIGHIGLSLNGTIAHNKILFNQSYNQGSTVNGGGLAIEGEGQIGAALSLGSGDVTVDGNLIMGNFAQGGHGGGVRLFMVNGDDVAQSSDSGNWWKVTLTNNIITNNVAGWSGGGISMADALNSVIINNTVASNDSVGIAGTLFSTQVNATRNTGPSTTVPSPAGVSSDLTSAALYAAVPNSPASRKRADKISNPTLTNNVIWHNRSFFFDMSTGVSRLLPSNNWNDAVTTNAANQVAGSELGPQSATGECVGGAKYWDIGVIGDTSPTPGTNALRPNYTIMSSTTGYTGTRNLQTDPGLVKVYCNGSRVQPGAQFEPATPFLPSFQLAPAATLDEGGNFVDLHYGPLSLIDPAQPASPAPVGDYHIASVTSSAYDAGTNRGAPAVDFDGDLRPQGNAFDIGADELRVVARVSSRTLNFGNVQVQTTQVMTVTLTNVGTQPLAFNGAVISGINNFAIQTNNCTGKVLLPASFGGGASTCTINVAFSPLAVGTQSATMTLSNSTATTSYTQTVALTGRGIP